MSGPTSDPSMDDILASIRRILSEDEPAASAAPPPPPNPDGAPGDDVLLLDTSMMVMENFPVEPSLSPAVPETANAPPPPRPPPADPAGGPVGDTIAHTLVGPATAAVAASSIGELVRTLSAERGTPVYRSGPSIEDLVREEIRPLLKAWLDANLGPVVERLVRAEIARVVGRVAP